MNKSGEITYHRINVPILKRLGKLFIAFLYLAGMVTGLFVVLVAPFEMFEKAQAQTWPSRKGVIQKSVAVQQFDFGLGSNGRPYWEAEICGVYKDSGEEFCIRRISLGLHVGSQTSASVLATVRRYPVGMEVDVYYEPANPKNTILEATSSWHEMLIAMGVAIAFLLSPVFLRSFFKQTRASGAPPRPWGK